MFDFNVKHIFKKKHIAADDLSRQFRKSSNNIDKIHEENIDDFIDEQFNCVRVCFVRIKKKKRTIFKRRIFEKFAKNRSLSYHFVLIE